MILSILICSITDRAESLQKLLLEFHNQAGYSNHYFENVEILTEVDNREISVGGKRQKLLERAKGDWIVFFDDDDIPNERYIYLILTAIFNNKDIDCIGIRGLMTTNGENPQTWCHRLGYKIEGDGNSILPCGYNYARPIIHFNPVKRELALQAGFKDMRFGEDMDYAERLNKLLTKEYFIDEQLFHYNYTNHVPHAKKYGIE